MEKVFDVLDCGYYFLKFNGFFSLPSEEKKHGQGQESESVKIKIDQRQVWNGKEFGRLVVRNC